MPVPTFRILFCICAVLLISTRIRAGDPVVVARGANGQVPAQPQAAVAPDGSVHLVYGIGDEVLYSHSSDGAQTFSQPQRAFRVTNMSLGMRRGPRIAATGKSLVVTAIGGVRGKGRDGDLQSWHSTDGGLTWQGPVKVNDAADSAREGLHGMAVGPDDAVWCAWLDLRDKRSEVFASKSVDGGTTWSSNVRVYQSPDGNVCECCHPSVVVSDRAVHVMFRNSLGGNRDMYVATSTDGGQSFAPAKKLGQGSWKLKACPMDGGMLAIGPKGSLATVWRRNGEIFAASGAGLQEQLLGRGEQPWIVSSANGPVIVWLERREGDLWLQEPTNPRPRKLGEAARDPMLAAPVGGSGPIVACWESKRDGQTMILAARIELAKLAER